MFYEITTRALAQFIGNTCFDLVATKADSDVGKRIATNSNGYACKVHNVKIKVKNIKVDTFLDPKGDITCIIHIPPTDFSIRTEELSKYYSKGDKLCFKGRTSPFDREIVFKGLAPRSMDDFNNTLATIVSAAECYITEEIAEHSHYDGWKVCCANVRVEYDKIFHNER